MGATQSSIPEEYKRNVSWIVVTKNGREVGRGNIILLEETLGLTCYRVVKDFEESSGYSIQVGLDKSNSSGKVEDSSEKYNYAFIRFTSPFPGCPEGLLSQRARPPQDRDVPIKVLCYLKDEQECKEIVMSTVHNCYETLHVRQVPGTFTNQFRFLYEEFSGAPMFNKDGKLVAMLSGGYSVNAGIGHEILIEYGRSIDDIINMGAKKIKSLYCKLSGLDAQGDKPSDISGTVETKDLLQGIDMSHLSLEEPKEAQMMMVQAPPPMMLMAHEGENPPLKLSLDLTIYNDDDLRKVFNPSSEFVSHLHRYLPYKPYDKETRSYSMPGCYRCTAKLCEVCDDMNEGSSFYSHANKSKNYIYQHIDCQDTYVIYLITCRHKNCGKQYVGLTKRKLKDRIKEHLSPKKATVSKHFRDEHNEQLCSFKFQGIQKIEKIRNDPKEEIRNQLLNNAEAYWIWRLQTMKPSGINKSEKSVKIHI